MIKKLPTIILPLIVAIIYFVLPFLIPSTTDTEKAILSSKIFDKLIAEPQISVEKLQTIIDEELSKKNIVLSITVFDELRYMQGIDYFKIKGGQKFTDILNKKIGESSIHSKSLRFEFEMKHEYWVKIYSTFFVFIFTLILAIFEQRKKEKLESELRQKAEENTSFKVKIDSSQKIIDSFKRTVICGGSITDNNIDALLNILGEKSYLDIEKENQDKLLRESQDLNSYQNIKL